MPAHQKKISVDLRGFHIFDDGDSSEEDNEEPNKTLKSKIKHAQMISVDLSGYHLFNNDNEDSDDESDNDDAKEDEDNAQAAIPKKPETSPPTKKMHNKKISVDLRGFDMFYESDPSSDEEGDDEDFGRVGDDKDDGAAASANKMDKEELAKNVNTTFKRAQKLYLGNKEEDDDLKGFHLFDEYDSDDEEAIKLNELTKDQLADLVRGFIVENALLKDANTRARDQLNSKKTRLKIVEESKRETVRQLASELNNMRSYIRGMGAKQTTHKSWLGM